MLLANLLLVTHYSRYTGQLIVLLYYRTKGENTMTKEQGHLYKIKSMIPYTNETSLQLLLLKITELHFLT